MPCLPACPPDATLGLQRASSPLSPCSVPGPHRARRGSVRIRPQAYETDKFHPYTERENLYSAYLRAFSSLLHDWRVILLFFLTHRPFLLRRSARARGVWRLSATLMYRHVVCPGGVSAGRSAPWTPTRRTSSTSQPSSTARARTGITTSQRYHAFRRSGTLISPRLPPAAGLLSNGGMPHDWVRRLSRFLRANYPFWDRFGGMDHVFWYTGDRGVCPMPDDMAKYIWRAETPEMISVLCGFSLVGFLAPPAAPPAVLPRPCDPQCTRLCRGRSPGVSAGCPTTATATTRSPWTRTRGTSVRASTLSTVRTRLRTRRRTQRSTRRICPALRRARRLRVHPARTTPRRHRPAAGRAQRRGAGPHDRRRVLPPAPPFPHIPTPTTTTAAARRLRRRPPHHLFIRARHASPIPPPAPHAPAQSLSTAAVSRATASSSSPGAPARSSRTIPRG